MVRQEIDLPIPSSGTNPQSMAVIVRECKTQSLIFLPESAARVQTRSAMKRLYCTAGRGPQEVVVEGGVRAAVES